MKGSLFFVKNFSFFYPFAFYSEYLYPNSCWDNRFLSQNNIEFENLLSLVEATRYKLKYLLLVILN